MRVYIAGPITDNEHYNNKFIRREKFLKDFGYEVCNPLRIAQRLEVELNRKPNYEECMEANLAELSKCDAINYLPGWELSNGAQREKERADSIGLQIVSVYELGGTRWK